MRVQDNFFIIPVQTAYVRTKSLSSFHSAASDGVFLEEPEIAAVLIVIHSGVTVGFSSSIQVIFYVIDIPSEFIVGELIAKNYDVIILSLSYTNFHNAQNFTFDSNPTFWTERHKFFLSRFKLPVSTSHITTLRSIRFKRIVAREKTFVFQSSLALKCMENHWIVAV